MTVHKPFYASGFLYHLGTAQILLHQPTDTIVASSWHLLGGKGTKGEDTKIAFKRITHELVKVKLDLKNIIPVYDYFSRQQFPHKFCQ
jgi:ADP-ribose pyrophosphatase YjhB (NUDIX family)